MTFICVAFNDAGEGVYGPEDVAGPTNVSPIGILRAITEEEMVDCRDPDGRIPEPLQSPDDPCADCEDTLCPHDQETSP